MGLSRSPPDGKAVALAGALSGQRGRRRTAARVIVLGALAVIALGVVGAVVTVLL